MKKPISERKAYAMVDKFFKQVSKEKANGKLTDEDYEGRLWDKWKALWKDRVIVDKLPNGETISEVCELSEEMKKDFVFQMMLIPEHL